MAKAGHDKLSGSQQLSVVHARLFSGVLDPAASAAWLQWCGSYKGIVLCKSVQRSHALLRSTANRAALVLGA